MFVTKYNPLIYGTGLNWKSVLIIVRFGCLNKTIFNNHEPKVRKVNGKK